MTDAKQALRDDISFMRALAEEGRATPMLGGSILLAAGLIFGGVQGLGLAALQLGLLRDHPALSVYLPFGAMAVFLAALSLLRRGLGARPGAHSPVNRATGSAWRGVGVAIMVLVAAFMLTSWRFADWRVFAVFPSVIFALYGAGWLVSAAMTRIGWMALVAYSSFGVALGIAALSDRVVIASTLEAASLFLLVALPGYLLMRQAPSDIV
jgi:hypothetical protein